MASIPTFPGLRRAAATAVVANVLIVLTGGIVRVTGSGLGCDQWPRCEGDSLVPTGSAEQGWHQWVEFGNRTLTFLLLAIGVWAFVAARREAEGRRDLLRLALVQPMGVVGQAVLGGITVLTDLHPMAVASHFLLSMVILAGAVVLYHRAAVGRAKDPPADSRDRATLLRTALTVLVVAASVVLVLGTVVTATGPHAGDADVARLGWLSIRTAAVIHAAAVWFLVGLTVASLTAAWSLVPGASPSQRLAPGSTTRALAIVLVAELAQGAIGYAQYMLGIPAELVSLHIVGSSLLWVAVLRARLTLASRIPGPPAPPAPPTRAQSEAEPVVA